MLPSSTRDIILNHSRGVTAPHKNTLINGAESHPPVFVDSFTWLHTLSFYTGNAVPKQGDAGSRGRRQRTSARYPVFGGGDPNANLIGLENDGGASIKDPIDMADPATILVTGGAGYIGSHTVLAFRQAGYRVIVLDDLSTGSRRAVPDDVIFFAGDAGNQATTTDLLRRYGVATVVHFAGSIVVPESVSNPLKYYRNNTEVSRSLIAACVDAGVKTLVFSSTAAVYGEPETVPIGEGTPACPENPYGRSKLVTEWMLRDTVAAHDFRFIALRYFNVAGADPEGRTGQSTPNATHLIKVACQVALGSRPYIEIFGDDYDTPDGTCVRDFIHVADLAEAHVDAVRHLQDGGESLILNCGYGRGYSVSEVLSTLERVSGCVLDARKAPRRPGDTPEVVADARRIRSLFHWTPRYDDLELIIRSALDWERTLLPDAEENR